jgi:hypothetical protein
MDEIHERGFFKNCNDDLTKVKRIYFLTFLLAIFLLPHFTRFVFFVSFVLKKIVTIQ